MILIKNVFLKLKNSKTYPEAAVSLGLFLLAVWPRAYDLDRFVTADEAKWVYRSAQFLAALIQGNWADTAVNLTPAVTTTWLGSFGLIGYYRLHQASLNMPLVEWLLSLPEFRTELDLLVATRWPPVILTALAVVAFYWLVRQLFNPAVAVIAAVLSALDPHPISLSRILGHDAPVTVFMSLSLLLLLLAVHYTSSRPLTGGKSRTALLWFTLSGIAAGLAFLSKAPALFLLPFSGLILFSQVWQDSTSLYFWVKRLLLWAGVAYLTFVIFWPAAWVDPLGQPQAVAENAVLSATDEEEAETEGFWLVPDLGPFYYIVNGSFKLSPLVMVGIGVALVLLWKQGAWGWFVPNFRKCSAWIAPLASKPYGGGFVNPPGAEQKSPKIWDTPGGHSLLDPQSPTVWLLLFILLFTIFMTVGDKRSPRYILPIFPPLAVIAAVGWMGLYHWAVAGLSGRGPQDRDLDPPILRLMFYGGLGLAGLIILLPHTPYYFTYYNPLLGGAYTAPHWVKIGWGEGLDRVGRFLQRELPDSRVGTAYSSTVAPFFQGDLSDLDGRNLDYLVLYSKQVQGGESPLLPSFIRYYEHFDPIFSVDLNGLHYADVYPGPAIQTAFTLTPGLDPAILPKPLGFRPLTPYGRIGETLEVDVLWLATDPLPNSPSVVTLEPLAVFNFSHADHDHETPEATPPPETATTILAEGSASLNRWAEGLVVSQHRLNPPANLPRGLYALRVDGRPLGEIELRNFQTPPNLAQVDQVFGAQIALTGYQFTPTEDYIQITATWQAKKTHLPAYTVFVQLLDAETNERLAGLDTQPQQGAWPTSRWVKDEVVVDDYFVAVPPGLEAGYFKIIIGLYQPETGERLLLANGQDHWPLPWTLIREDKAPF